MHSSQERNRKLCNPVRLATLQTCYSRFYLKLRIERHKFVFFFFSIPSVFTKIPELSHAWESFSEFLSYTFLQVELRVGGAPDSEELQRFAGFRAVIAIQLETFKPRTRRISKCDPPSSRSKVVFIIMMMMIIIIIEHQGLDPLIRSVS